MKAGADSRPGSLSCLTSTNVNDWHAVSHLFSACTNREHIKEPEVVSYERLLHAVTIPQPQFVTAQCFCALSRQRLPDLPGEHGLQHKVSAQEGLYQTF